MHLLPNQNINFVVLIATYYSAFVSRQFVGTSLIQEIQDSLFSRLSSWECNDIE